MEQTETAKQEGDGQEGGLYVEIDVFRRRFRLKGKIRPSVSVRRQKGGGGGTKARVKVLTVGQSYPAALPAFVPCQPGPVMVIYLLLAFTGF